MSFSRAAGILLHPTSLPGFGGIGSIGAAAEKFAQQLAAADVSLWQVLPLGPTGYADSPYAAFSAFAGNPLLIALEPLVSEGLLQDSDLAILAGLPTGKVDFGRVVPDKLSVLRRAYERLRQTSGSPAVECRATAETDELREFREENNEWLEDFALFMALKARHGGAPWWEWEAELRRRDPSALQQAREEAASDIDFHRYLQFLFFRQWKALRRHVNQLGIRFIGDIPIFVAHDSSDVWANQHLFQLDEAGMPTVVAGVPPDYFTATGQLWGNPHYRWDVMAADGFRWWIDRFRRLLELVDIIRLDHFRGFAAAWNVPFGDDTAIHGEWIATPGQDLFAALTRELGQLPIIAEDLGFITPDVVELRRRLGFPGMHILQFAFGSGPSNPSLPHNLTRDAVVYTGTHDNSTTVEWFSEISPEERSYVLDYCGIAGPEDIHWDLMRLAFASVAEMAIVPLQDVLGLGAEARMNFPGRAAGNWTWRFITEDFSQNHTSRLRKLIKTYDRNVVEAEPGPRGG